MIVDSVVERGHFSLWESVGNYFGHSDYALSAFGFILLALGGTVLLVVMGYSFIFELTNKSRFDLDDPDVPARAARTVGIVFVIALLAGFFSAVIGYRNSPNSDMVTAWKRDHVTPYLMSLPDRRITLLTVEPAEERSSVRPFFKDSSMHEQVTPMALSFRDDHGETITVTTLAVLKYDIIDGDAPYMVCKKIEWSLGHGIERGIYNPIVHLTQQP